ncbi:hypothetical protein RQP46_001290 [Phenoliferia psychrophenolica]
MDNPMFILTLFCMPVCQALWIAIKLGLIWKSTSKTIVQLCNVFTIAFGAWELARLVHLTQKGSVEGRKLVWGLMILKILEHAIMTESTTYPLWTMATVPEPYLVYNWVRPQRSKARLHLLLAFFAAFLFRNLFEAKWGTGSRIIITNGLLNPNYASPRPLTSTHSVWSKVVAAPTCALVAIDLSSGGGGDNSTASPSITFKDEITTLQYTFAEEEQKHKTADDASNPEYLPYEAYNSIGGAGSLDPPLLEGYVNYWIEHWKLALFGDLVFAYVVYRSISFLRDDSDATESGVERVSRGVNCLFWLKVSLSYITSTPMVGPPRRTFPLLDIITSLTEFVPKTAKQSFLRPRVALLHLLVCWTTRVIVLRELDRDLTKEDLEEVVAAEVKRAAEMTEPEEAGATVGTPVEV